MENFRRSTRGSGSSKTQNGGTTGGAGHSDPLREAIADYRDEGDDWADLTPVINDAIAKGMDELGRREQKTLPESDPPAALSLGAPGGWHLSARGLVAYLAAILGILLLVYITKLLPR